MNRSNTTHPVLGIRAMAATITTALALALAGAAGYTPSAEAATGKSAASFAGSRDFIVIYREEVGLAPRLRSEVRRGNEVEDRYTSSINGALLELGADDVNRLRQDDRVLSVTPDRRVSIAGQERSRRSASWGLDRVNQRNLPLDGLAGMLRSGTGVEAYIIDTGIRSSHSDLAGRVNPEGFSAHGSKEDCNGHGTHVAGTVAGSQYGVAPGARLTGVKVLDCEGSGWGSDVIAGIDWMIRDHIEDARAGRSRGGASQVDRAAGQTVDSQATERTSRVSKKVGVNGDPKPKKIVEPRSKQSAEVSTSSYGSGSIQNLRRSSNGSSYDFRASATVNSNICSPSGSCVWFPLATVFPEGTQCNSAGTGGTIAWVGDVREQTGTQTGDDYAFMPGAAPWRFCIYAYTSSGYRLLHQAVLSPSDSTNPDPNRPANDNFADRQTLTSLNAVSGSTVNATAESGEPGHYNSRAYSSIWYRWTAPANGNLVVTTAGSSFDTTLAAYSGSSLGSLNQLAENDDADGGRTSRISIPVTSGTSYSFAIDGYGADTGSTTLAGTFTQGGGTPGDPPPPTDPTPTRPANDNFADRQTLTSLNAVSGSTVNATAESGEPGHYNSRAYSSIWYRWTAPANGNLVVTTAGSSFDTTLAAYSGSSLGTLTRLAQNDDADGARTSRITVPVTSGTSYLFAIDGFSGATGSTRIAGTFTEGGGGTPGDPGGPPPPFRSAVANMSIGGSRSEAENTAVQRAIDAGITVVVAAGNENDDACRYSPASAPNAITVGSTDSSDARSYFSNTGSCVDLFAPGEEIASAWHESDSATKVLSGTSMASPHVAGAAAQLLAEDRSMTPAAVAQELTATATRDIVANVASGTPNLLLHVPAQAEARVSAPEGDVLTSARQNTANISISGSEAGSFECSLNGAEWQSCRPGVTSYPGLGLGSHEFRLRGTVDGRPIPETTRSWRYVPAAPVITRGPKRGISRKALFRFQKIEGLQAQCKLDRGPWRTCGSPKRYKGLKPGRHTFRVRQVSGDLVSPVESRTWKIVKKKRKGARG